MFVLKYILDIIVDYIIPIIVVIIVIAGFIISIRIRRRKKYESYFKSALEKGRNKNTFEKIEKFSKYSTEIRIKLTIHVNSIIDNLPMRILCRAAVQSSPQMQKEIIRTEPTKCLREYPLWEKNLQEIENFMNRHPQMRDFDKKFQETILKNCKNCRNLLDAIANYNNHLRPFTNFNICNKNGREHSILDDYTSLKEQELSEKLALYKNTLQREGIDINKLLERDKKFVKEVNNRKNEIVKFAKRIEKNNRKFKRLTDYYLGKYGLK